MSALPSPVKSAATTCFQFTPVLFVADALGTHDVVHSVVWKDVPVDRPTHHRPVVDSWPAMSVLPSPLKSPKTTWSQWKLALSAAQVAHSWLVKVLPLEMPTHHWPLS